jgi:hypothetical protein
MKIAVLKLLVTLHVFKLLDWEHTLYVIAGTETMSSTAPPLLLHKLHHFTHKGALKLLQY